jgi:hypothetical protein
MSSKRKLDITSYGTVAIAKFSDTTMVVYPSLSGSLLTKQEARLLGRAIIFMSRTMKDPERFIPTKKTRLKRAKNK